MSDGDTTPVTRSFLNNQNITIPSGYHFASGSELNGNQQPNITWEKLNRRLRYMLKKQSHRPRPQRLPQPQHLVEAIQTPV